MPIAHGGLAQQIVSEMLRPTPGQVHQAEHPRIGHRLSTSDPILFMSTSVI